MSDFMRAHMGHRFVLRSSRLTDSAAPGGTLQLAFSVENTGFGDLFLPTKTEVLLQAADDRFWACPVALDFGAAVPSRTNAALSLSLRLPSGVTNGIWRVYLRTHIPVAGDSPSAAGTRTVRFAHADAQWNAALGANLLGSFRVSGAAAQPGLDFRETGAAAAGATAPQIVLAALPAGAAPSVPLSEWSGRALRLYAPGDRMQRVNWKISAKYDDLYVKEFELMYDRTLTLLIELRRDSDEVGFLDELITAFYSAALRLIELEITFFIINFWR